MIKPEIIELLKANSIFFESPWHGFSHWQRVEANGLYLAGINGADKAVVSYFAYFHDCMRENEDIDHGHGWRGAQFAEKYRELIDLDDDQFRVFYDACRWHTDDNESDCLTLNTCRDADRLDLSRVGIIPDPEYFFNEEAKKIARLTSSWQDVQEYIDSRRSN
jgi:uncharacterized protein